MVGKWMPDPIVARDLRPGRILTASRAVAATSGDAILNTPAITNITRANRVEPMRLDLNATNGPPNGCMNLGHGVGAGAGNATSKNNNNTYTGPTGDTSAPKRQLYEL